MEEDRVGILRELDRRAQVHNRPYLAKAAIRWCTCQSQFAKRVCTGESHHRLLTLNRCEQRICPWCARRAAAKQVAKISEIFEALNKAGAFLKGRTTNRPSFKMLTLTLAPRDDLAAGVREIAGYWRELQHRLGLERDKRDRLFGAFAASEIGPHRNVHLHVTYWGRFLPKDLVSRTWQEITGDSYVVDIKELRGSWRDAVRETCKYVTKLAETDAAGRSADADRCLPELFLVDVLEAYRGRRRIMTYGVFYNPDGIPEAEDQVCAQCGEPLTYVGTFAPEHLHAFELLDYFHPPGEAAA